MKQKQVFLLFQLRKTRCTSQREVRRRHSRLHVEYRTLIDPQHNTMNNHLNITGSGTESSALDAPFYNEEQPTAPMSDVATHRSFSITHPNNSCEGFNAQQMSPESHYWNQFTESIVPSGYAQSSGVEGDGNGLNNHFSSNNNNEDSLHQEAHSEQNDDAQRPLSPGSFGSFSMDGEDMMDHSDPFHDGTPVRNNIPPSADVAGNGPPVLPNEPSSLSSVPQIQTSADTNSIVIQRTNEVLINNHNGSIPQPSQVHSTHKNESGIGPNDQYEANLQSMESTNDHQILIHAPPVTTNTDRQIDERNNSQHHPQQQQPEQGGNDEVIELLDDDDGDNGGTQTTNRPLPMNSSMVTSAGVKRLRPPETVGSNSVVPGSSLTGYQAYRNQYPHNHQYKHKPPVPGSQTAAIEELARRQRLKLQRHNTAATSNKVSKPHYLEVAPNYTATWFEPLPPLPRMTPQQTHRKQYKHFELSLLNVSEFTITGLPVTFDGRPSSVLGFRKIIKEVSRGHGKPIFERDNPKQNGSRENNSSNDPILNDDEDNTNGGQKNPDGGKWRIPLVCLLVRLRHH